MFIKRKLMHTRVADVCLLMFCVMFICSLVFINFYLSGLISRKRQNLNYAETDESLKEEILPLAVESSGGGRRVRRAVASDTSSTWTIPEDPNPVSLGVPWGGCPSPTILSSQFPNATCFSQCNAEPCSSNLLSNLQDGSEELICTAKIIQLGFRRTGTYDITRWLKQHPDVQTVTGNMFTSSGQVVFDSCPDMQLADVTTSFHFNSYSIESIASQSQQKNFYIHCEECLTTAFLEIYFGTLFLDLPTAMFPYIESNDQKFIVTLKNPTDRVIAEYFYPHIQDGTDLSTVGSQVLHDAMSAAIDEAKTCMFEPSFGPTACVYGIKPGLAETAMLYESCYSTHLTQLVQQVPQSKIYFMKIEEFQADSAAHMNSLYKFLGIRYPGYVSKPTGSQIHKPILTQTVEMLDAFFAPFNTELSTLLSDSKWLYTRA